MTFCFQDPTPGLQRGLVLLLLHPLFDTGLAFPAGESWWRLSPGPGPGFLDHHVSSWTISASHIELLRTLTPICPVSGWIYLRTLVDITRAALIITISFWEKLNMIQVACGGNSVSRDRRVNQGSRCIAWQQGLFHWEWVELLKHCRSYPLSD